MRPLTLEAPPDTAMSLDDGGEEGAANGTAASGESADADAMDTCVEQLSNVNLT